MKSQEEILAPYVERVFRHSKVVDKDNAIKAINEYHDQFSNNQVKTIEEVKEKTERLMKSWQHLDRQDQHILEMQFNTLISLI